MCEIPAAARSRTLRSSTLDLNTCTLPLAKETVESWGTLSRGSSDAPERAVYLAPGDTLNGRYVIEDLLGEGAMGVVYKVRDELHPKRDLALKTIRGGSIDADQVALFKVEFETMAKLRHPHVARVYDFEAIHGSADHLFTMEYVPGVDLYQATENRSYQEMLDLLVQVCRALSYLHSRDVIHYDIKPSNVLVDSNGRVRVVDFGLAGARFRNAAGQVIGTPAYLAPELTALGSVDRRADLYSLGVMAYHLLCRRPPFLAEKLIDLLYQQCFAGVVFDPEVCRVVPRWLRDLVQRLMAKEPADRFPTANAVIEAINRLGGLDHEIETTETRESYVLSSRFVGRDTEFRALVNFVRARTEDRSGVTPPALWLGGESGIGKSRIMREVRLHVQLGRCLFLEGDCYEGAFSEYGPLVEILQHAAGVAHAIGAEELCEQHGTELVTMVPSLGEGRDLEPSRPAGDPHAERLRLLQGVSEFLIGLAYRVPFAMYVNDLQWARPGTIDLLEFLIRSVADQERAGRAVPLALLGSFREDEIDGRPAQRPIQELAASGSLRLIWLQALGAAQIQRLISSMLGLEQLPRSFVVRVAAETAGNPFFIEEVMRALIENGSVYLRSGAWAAETEIGRLDIPVSMSAVFLRRANLLPRRERQLIDVLAVCGMPAPLAVIERAAELTRGSLVEVLASLVRRRMVQRLPGEEGRYRLSHDRMRETLVQEIDEDARQGLHQQIGAAIEQTYVEDPDDHLAELAHHYWHARDLLKARHYNLAAGDQAAARYANDLAIELYGRALELVPGGEDGQALRLRLTENLGDLRRLTGDYDEAFGAYEHVLERVPTDLDRARLRRKIGILRFQKGDHPGSVEHTWEAIALLGDRRPRTLVGQGLELLMAIGTHVIRRLMPWTVRPCTDPAKRRHLAELSATYLRLMYVYYFFDPKEMLLPVLRAANISERLGTCPDLSHAYTVLGMVYGSLGFFRSAIRYGRQAIRIAEQLDSPWHIAAAKSYTSMVYYYMTDWDTSDELSRDARDTFLACGDMFELANACSHLFMTAYYRGDLIAARQEIEQGRQMMERTGSLQFGKTLHLLGGVAASKLGDGATARQTIQEAIEMCRAGGDNFVLSTCQYGLGSCLLAHGDPVGAVEQLERARKNIEAIGLTLEYQVATYSTLARASLEVLETSPDLDRRQARQRRHQVARYVRTALKLARRFRSHEPLSFLGRARLAWYDGQGTLARRWLDRAVRRAESLGARYQLGEILYEAARVLARGTAEDRVQAREHAERAVPIFEECRATHFAADARDLLTDLDQRR